MAMKTYWLAAAAFLIAAPLAAQTAAKEDAVNAVEGPVTQALNNNVDANASTTDAQNAANQAQYASDKAAYWAAIRANHHEIAQNDAHYMHQQDAYAAAMHDWRVQVALCKRGHQRACDLPTPDPAAYM